MLTHPARLWPRLASARPRHAWLVWKAQLVAGSVILYFCTALTIHDNVFWNGITSQELILWLSTSRGTLPNLAGWLLQTDQLAGWLWKGRKPLPSLHCAVQERMDCGQLTAVSWWTKEEWMHGWVDVESVVLVMREWVFSFSFLLFTVATLTLKIGWFQGKM